MSYYVVGVFCCCDFQVSSLKMELAEKRPAINFGAQV